MRTDNHTAVAAPPQHPEKFSYYRHKSETCKQLLHHKWKKGPFCLPGQGPAKSQWVSKIQPSSVGAWWPTPPHSQRLGPLSVARLVVVQDNLEGSTRVGVTERLHLETFLYVIFRTSFFFLMYCIEKKKMCSIIISSFYECLSHARYYGLKHHLT